ncbi:lamin tail domain-containing protein [Actinoplanes sp. NPDC051633]|uniref:lamin tail domain-containing protein n=1 Tax=Actinoplanes sp. NPDC051633 TaxID=3155670 RepID=UPI003438A6C9
MRRKQVVAIMTAVPLAIGAVTVPSFAATTPAISISKVQYNSPGSDTRSNASLNAEYVRLRNNTGSSIALTGWTVRDKAGHVYKFGTYTIRAGKYVYIHTGKGTNGRPDVQHVYQQRGAYVWNNDGDTAYLRNAAGKAIDTCSWKSGTTPTYC